VLAQPALSEYFRLLRPQSWGVEGSGGTVTLPVRVFDPASLITTSGQSVLSQLLKRVDYIIIEDADLRPSDLFEHLTRFHLEGAVPIGLLMVQTRSSLVEHDFDLLAEMPFVCLSMTVETDDDSVRSALTPTCPSIGRRLATMRRAREAGILVQAAVSPTLPHSAHRFAALLAESADRVIVDTVLGDGAGGKRTRKSALPGRFSDLGYGAWDDISAPQHLFTVLQERMGSHRVTWSQAGFNALAVEAQGHARTVWA
jgi:hypothetical protein